MKRIYSIAALLLLHLTALAQNDKVDSAKNGRGGTISILAGSTETDDSTKNKKRFTLKMGHDEKKVDTSDKVFDLHIGLLDLGFNYIEDRTDYASAAAQNFLQVGDDLKNKNLFSLREGKSVNVNIYPVLIKAKLVKTKGQRLYVTLGAGLQLYNFRFNKPVTYLNETSPVVVMDSIAFTKNKVGLTYLSVPLMVTSKTRLAKDIWLVYGAGVSAGYRIASWTKQVSGERGKEKNHDQFNFNNFNTCVTAEVGIDGWLRLYASYQLTPLHENALEQYPYAIGVRFLGI